MTQSMRELAFVLGPVWICLNTAAMKHTLNELTTINTSLRHGKVKVEKHDEESRQINIYHFSNAI
jgi:hypothetical protein